MPRVVCAAGQGSGQLVFKHLGGNKPKCVLKGFPVKSQVVNILGFMGHGICVNSLVPVSLQKQPQTVHKRTGMDCAIKPDSQKQAIVLAQGARGPLPAAIVLSTQRVRWPRWPARSSQHRDVRRVVQAGSERCQWDASADLFPAD